MAKLTRWLLRAAALVALIYAGHTVIEIVVPWFDMTLLPETEELMHRAIVVAIGLFMILMAIPFVPGAEIGLTLLTVVGGTLAPLIYLATATSLTFAFLVGRLLPPGVLHKGLNALGLHRAASLVAEAAALSEAELHEKLIAGVTSPWARNLLRHRYVALALIINLPGNMVLGGGGGISMIAGLSRMFHPLPFVLTVLIAVLPVPLIFYVGLN
ncbi:hypothetical protein [Actibacterium pelagium]|uniref:SNARE associated Golgi protein n=1 Tax=Actibacterium pelagium TaxID=2029103 RepID=A0A917EKA7_9RHOB|nr:hypothetical protein [Actibacterium pelagium]GGE48095.1 hypothetical protein GCM10011517_14850 [Actibacterium pelagium]